MIVKLPAILSKVSSRKDRSYSLSFDTRELSGNDAAILLDQLQAEGWLLFSPENDMEQTDIPDEKADSMTGKKSQAQRLRSVIYLLWQQKGKNGQFETYYASVLESMIDQIKEKLDGQS